LKTKIEPTSLWSIYQIKLLLTESTFMIT